MVKLYGQTLSRREVAERSGALSQFAGVRLMTLCDGVERGVRLLEFRTGSGLRFTILVDRGFDIGDCEFKGQAIGWHSPSGFREDFFLRRELPSTARLYREDFMILSCLPLRNSHRA